jgi:hypothetical protein
MSEQIPLITQLAIVAAPLALLAIMHLLLSRRLASIHQAHALRMKQFDLRHKCFELVCDDRKLHSEGRFRNGLIRWLNK